MEKRERPTETSWSKRPPCSQRRKQLDVEDHDDEEIPYVPEDIIFDILLRCPPDFLYDSARFVCKTWYNLIRNPRFTSDHLLRHVHTTDHTVGLLFINNNPRTKISRFLEISEGNIKLTDFRHPFPAQILATSYGVALYYRIENFAESLYVVNPVTKQVVKLPRPDFKRLRFYFRWSCISYLPGTGEIKVVTRAKDMGEQYHWYILTVGRKMSWRKVVSTINPEGITVRGFVSDGMPTCVGGVVYWKFGDKIVGIDLCDEIIHYFYLPMTLKSQGSRLLEMGNRLCMIEMTRPSILRPENVWIMKDLQQKEWAIIYKLDVNFELKNAGILFPRPIGWLENEQMLLFEEYVRGSPSSEVVPVIVAYDVRTGTRTSYRRSLYLSLDDIVLVHSSSLISW